MSQSHVRTGFRAGLRSACLVVPVTLVAAAFPASAGAQQGDREAVLAVVDRLFDARITSYNVCYTKLLRVRAGRPADVHPAQRAELQH